MTHSATGYDVVIPAGGQIDAAYAEEIGSECRALAPFGADRRPVLQQVINTLRTVDGVRRIIVIAPDAVQGAVTGADIWLPAGKSGARNILDGLEVADPTRPALICPSDLPLLTSEGITEFLRRCRPDSEVAVGIVGADDYQARFPDAPPSQFVTLADAGAVTIGGVFAVHPHVIGRHAALLESLFASRKSQWRMARLLGPRLLWKWVAKSLSLPDVLLRAEQIIGGPVQAICGVSPNLAYDIDTLDDYTYANLHFE